MCYNRRVLSDPAEVARDPSLNSPAIRVQLERVLTSPQFRDAERRRRLLKYLVEKALAGDPIKEYAIGLDVFDKPADFDPQLDPAVRVEMGRLRSRLNDYYQARGAGDALQSKFRKAATFLYFA